jgi:hypothetical protein
VRPTTRFALARTGNHEKFLLAAIAKVKRQAFTELSADCRGRDEGKERSLWIKDTKLQKLQNI